MEDQRKASLYLDQSKRIRSVSLDRSDLQKLLEILQERSYAAADLEITNFQKLEGQTDEQYENDKERVKKGFEFHLTLTGADGRKLTGSINDIFSSLNFPDEVSKVYINTATPLNVSYNYQPRNSFTLFLDFDRPTVLNFSILPSQETNNESNISINGKDTIWVNGVFNEFVNYISQRPSKASWLHRHSIYDILLCLIGIPVSFWICSKASNSISSVFGSVSQFLEAAAYFYIFIISLNAFRVLFHYARWIWPLIEYKSKKSSVNKHRLLLGAILLSVFSSIVCDIIKSIVT